MTPTQWQRLVDTRDLAASLDEIDFSTFFHDCGAPACVLGHAARELYEDEVEIYQNAWNDWVLRRRHSSLRGHEAIEELIGTLYGSEPSVVHLFMWTQWPSKESWLTAAEEVLAAWDPEAS